jgi:hypothetical protein
VTDLRRAGSALAVVLLAVVSGCIYTPMVSPEILKPGDYSTGVSLSGAVPDSGSEPYGFLSIYGRRGLSEKYEIGVGYTHPIGFYVDAKWQLIAEPDSEPSADPVPLLGSSRRLAAADLCLSIDRGESYAADAGRPLCWAIGIAPSIVAGTADLHGGARLLLQCEFTNQHPRYYAFPGLIGGASLIASDMPFRISPSAGLFLDPGLNRRPVQMLIVAGVSLQFDFDRSVRDQARSDLTQNEEILDCAQDRKSTEEP